MSQIFEIVDGPAHLNGKQIQVIGTLQECMGVSDVWTQPQAREHQVIRSYLDTKPPAAGTVYCGKVRFDGQRFPSDLCVHESWLARDGVGRGACRPGPRGGPAA